MMKNNRSLSSAVFVIAIAIMVAFVVFGMVTAEAGTGRYLQPLGPGKTVWTQVLCRTPEAVERVTRVDDESDQYGRLMELQAKGLCFSAEPSIPVVIGYRVKSWQPDWIDPHYQLTVVAVTPPVFKGKRVSRHVLFTYVAESVTDI